MFGHKQVPSHRGGIEVAVEALAVRMAKLGHDVTLYSRGKNPALTSEMYNGVRIRSVPVVNISGVAAVMGSAFAALRAVFGRYDCIHIHAEGPALMTFLPHLRGIRTVVTIHGLDWKRSKWGNFASWYLKLGEKCAAKYADEIIVLSSATQTYFRETYGRETVYIPNGVEPVQKQDAAAITEQWRLRKNEYLLYLGRIVPEKELLTLIKSFKEVKTDKKLVVAGSSKDMPSYYEQVRQAAAEDPRIIFVGFAQGQVLEELFSNSYLYCLPSNLEGMPISLLEALSFGCCCVCSDIAECTEVVGEDGFTFPVGDAQKLRDLLQQLCDKEVLVDDCKRRVSRNFIPMSWDQVVEKTLELYQPKESC